MLFICIASSATVVLEKYKGTTEYTIKIKDEIYLQDLQEFKDALQQIDDYHSVLHMNAVQLDSRGGSGTTAKEIGKILRARKLNTYLSPSASCASACIDILASGVMRYAFGEVQIHRATYSGEIPQDQNIAVDIEGWKNKSFEYFSAMGMGNMLADAIQSTPSWRLRTLSPTEISQWQLFGIDQLTEEELFTNLAKERFISRNEFIDIYKQNYDECLNQAKSFSETIFDCVKLKKIKRITWYESLVDRFTDWIISLDKRLNFIKSYDDRIKDLRKDIRSKNIYLRYMDVSAIEGNILEPNGGRIQPLPNEVAKAMEAKNEWWVNKNNIYINLANPTSQDIKSITFSLSTTDCHSKGIMRYMKLNLPEPLDGYRSVIYMGALPFDYEKEYGKGERCGVVEEVIL